MTTTHTASTPDRAAPPAPDTPWSDADPFGAEILEDPTGFHTTLRDTAPVVHLRRWDVYGMGRYEDVHAALTDWQRFESGAGVGWSNFRYEKPWRPPSLLLEADPPRHDAPRAVLSAILGPRALRRLRAQWFADAERLVDNLLSGRVVVDTDAMTSLAEAFPLQVFPDAVGLGRDGRENLLPYGDHLFNAFGPPNELVEKGNVRAPDLLAWVIAACARDRLTDDGLGAEIWAASDRGEITPTQAPMVVRSLLSAGVDTTVHGIAAVLYAFATHPAEWERLRTQPSLARVAFDEAVRWESPVQTFFRTATTDVPVGDVVIPDGAKILMFLASANRDPRRWREPDRFDLSRDPSGHVGFGMGLHQCVGQHVARLEAEALLTALVARVRTIELTDAPRRHHNNTMRGFENLPVRLRAV